MAGAGGVTAGPSGKFGRFVAIDAWRGFALLLMVIYHFCFDLAWFDLADFDFYRDAFWRHARTFILSQFLLLVGISLVLATRRGLDGRRFLHRMGWLLASAALVSLATWWMFGDRMVVFGVLHFIAVASVLGLLFVHRPRVSAAAGLAIVLAGNLLQSPVFDRPAWHWIGFMTHRPATEDYVPLFPWFGVVLLGIAAGHLLSGDPGRRALAAMGNGRGIRALAFSGRHSLLIYMLHQPVLTGLLYAALWLAR